jgi:hypothetical protein
MISTEQEVKRQILDGILSSTPHIIINGLKIKLPTPQRTGTSMQMTDYALMKTREILDQLKVKWDFVDGDRWWVDSVKTK